MQQGGQIRQRLVKVANVADASRTDSCVNYLQVIADSTMYTLIVQKPNYFQMNENKLCLQRTKCLQTFECRCYDELAVEI